ncbi:MAG: PAS domain S-box protein [Janthinobacterium lividum]
MDNQAHLELNSDVPDLQVQLSQSIELQKGAELDLKRAQTDFSYLFEKNPLPMWKYESGSHNFVDVNQAATRQYGYQRDEFLAMRLKDMLPVELLTEAAGGTRPNTPYQHSSSWHHPHKDGSVLEVDIVSHAIMVDRNRPWTAGRCAAKYRFERKRCDDRRRPLEDHRSEFHYFTRTA